VIVGVFGAVLMFGTAPFAFAAGGPPSSLSGGGCLNLPGPPERHIQATFGGNAMLDQPGASSGSSWEHVLRDGRIIVFRFASRDARLVRVRREASPTCTPPSAMTRGILEWTGRFSTSSGEVDEEGNFEVTILDVGSCDSRDHYAIRVRRGLVIGQGEIVYEISGELDCGQLRIDAPWN
jgi:hypothetical protein